MLYKNSTPIPKRILLIGLYVLLFLLAANTNPVDSNAPSKKISPSLYKILAAQNNPRFWVMLSPDMSIQSAQLSSNPEERSKQVISQLKAAAGRSQSLLQKQLRKHGASFRSFWVVNAVLVNGDAQLAADLAALPEVQSILPDTPLELIDASSSTLQQNLFQTDAIPWNINKVNAPTVWSNYQDTGEGVVVAAIDSGVQFDHPALIRQYRGRQGDGSFDHNYNWFDATDTCPNPEPCDTVGHGTHVMGIMVGQTEDMSHQTGIAPGAKWIAVRACTPAGCKPEDVLAAGQWILEPTDLSNGNPRPDLRPDIVNNSWGGPGTIDAEFFRPMVEAWRAAGILPVFAAGNNGRGCGSVYYPAYYPESLAVGATDAEDIIASFSNFGPSPIGNIIKPDLSAPGSDILSTFPTDRVPSGYYTKSGTSMAAPHISGAAALLWSAFPSLANQVEKTETILKSTAVDRSNQFCGGTAWNNNVYGEGRLDVEAMLTRANFLLSSQRQFLPLLK